MSSLVPNYDYNRSSHAVHYSLVNSTYTNLVKVTNAS